MILACRGNRKLACEAYSQAIIGLQPVIWLTPKMEFSRALPTMS
jgi:hypothetical protein